MSIGAPRVLLRRLREIMAQQADPQDSLDRIVNQIASNLVAEVSSVYVMHGDGTLELCATEGLNKAAVHTTLLEPGEGLVGLVAETAQPVNLTDARAHPAFSYKPETGEDPYHAFLGVPVLRGGEAVGVLTLQNKVERRYSEEEVEALQTTAMVVAELIASSDIVVAENGDESALGSKPFSTRGSVLCEGIALGHAVLHVPRIEVTQLIAEDVDNQLSRLGDGISMLTRNIDDMLKRGEIARAGEHREVLEAYRMFANDRGWQRRLEEAVRTGLTAEAAVERVQNDMRAQMMRQTDPYIRERLHDFDDLSHRLLRILTGQTTTASEEGIPDDAILIARNMGAAELLDYDRQHLRGLILEEGAQTSHVAIVARALGIAAVGQATDVVAKVEAGDAVIVDGEGGEVHVRPNQDVIHAYSDKVRFRAKRQQQYAKLRDKPCVTKDGQRIGMYVNAGLLVDLPHLEESGADGVGLFRTELQFMIASTFPRLGQQIETYRSIIEAAGGKPVVFRTLDIGGDKMLPYLRHAQEENPALGWRAIRMSLDRPGLFRTQIRALMRASAGRELRIMLPMLADVSEFDAAKRLVEREKRVIREYGHKGPKKVLLGAMIEVPAIVWQLDQLLPKADFISVGSNDLQQFLFAADRGNRRVASRFESLSATMLRVLKQIADAAHKHNVPLTLCGEMAGHPLEAMALIGLGFTKISMAPASMGPVKNMILSLDTGPLKDTLLPLLDAGEGDIRTALEDFAAEHHIPL